MSTFDTVARPYAQAIFETAIENHTIQKWKKFLIFISKIASSKKIRKCLSGSVAPQYLSSLFIKIGSDIDVIDQNSENLIKLLANNQRFNICNNILRQFLKLESDYKNIIVVQLRSAFLLKEKQISKIQEILEDSFLKKIKILYKIDSQILDGLIIKINDTVFNFSINNYLKQLSNSLNFEENNICD